MPASPQQLCTCIPRALVGQASRGSYWLDHDLRNYDPTIIIIASLIIIGIIITAYVSLEHISRRKSRFSGSFCAHTCGITTSQPVRTPTAPAPRVVFRVFSARNRHAIAVAVSQSFHTSLPLFDLFRRMLCWGEACSPLRKIVYASNI